MKLALITHKVARGEGQARVNFEIVRRAAEMGWQVTLAAGQVAPELQNCANVTWVRIPWTARYSDLVGVWKFARQSGNWLRDSGQAFDVVHVNGFVTRCDSDVNTVHFVHASWLKSPWHPCRTQSHSHSGRLSKVHSAYQWLFSALNARWEQQAFARTRQLIAVSPLVRQELEAAGVAPAKIQVIGNGVDLEEFCPGGADRNALGLPPDAPLGLFAGDLRLMRKNLDTVFHALTRLSQLHLAVAGKLGGSPYPALAAQLGISDRVHFLGFRADMPEIMRACDFLAFPSRYEPFGLALLEALASGLPVLTASSVGGASLVTPDCGHVLADAENDGELAGVVQKWLDNPQRMKSMGRAARQIAQEHSWDQMADAYLRLYAEIAQAKAQESPQKAVLP